MKAPKQFATVNNCYYNKSDIFLFSNTYQFPLFLSSGIHHSNPVNLVQAKPASTEMDLKFIETFFKFGKYFALTPSSLSDRKPSKFQSFYTLFVVFLYLVAYAVVMYYSWTVFKKLTIAQFVLALLSSVAFFTHDLYIFLGLKMYKRKQLFKLLDNLQATSRIGSGTKLYHFIFLMSQLVLILVGNFGNYLYLMFLGVDNFILNMFNFTQIYLQSAFVLLRCIVLDMVLSRYQRQSRLLLVLTLRNKPPRDLSQVVKAIAKNINVLKCSVDIFNEIFGVPILLHMFCGVSNTLVSLDVFIKSDGTFNAGSTMLNFFNLVYQMTLSVIFWVREAQLMTIC
jgi:hypothetical protein